MHLLCRICLREDDNVTDMNFIDLNVFETVFMKIPQYPETSYLCIYCRHLMKKFVRFYRQCLTANEYFAQIITDDSKLNNIKMFSKVMDLKICHISSEIWIKEKEYEKKSFTELKKENELSVAETYDSNSQDSSGKSDVKLEEFSEFANNSDFEIKEESMDLEENFVCTYDELPLAKLCRSSKKDFYKECKRKKKHKSPVSSHTECVTKSCNGEKKKHKHIKKTVKYSDDEVPLAELRENRTECFSETRERRKKRTGRRKKTNDEQPVTDTGSEENKRRKWVTAKHIPREGFTSKMVPETDEYVVIKMSKEQVLNEMSERAKSEKYSRHPFKCEKCVKGFNFEDVLQNHVQKHVPRPGYIQCDICHQFCPSMVSFRGHMKSHTTRYKCKICGDVRLSRQHLLEHHALKHTGIVKTYTCEHCQFTSNKRTIMQRHVRNHNNKDSHACDKCGKLFPNITALRTHVVRHSKMEKCEQCGRKFISLSLLHSHVLAVHERRDFYCVECDVKFQSAYNLQLHLKRTRRHRDESSYKFKCPRCPRRYVYQSGVTSHLTSSHGELSSHLCQMCDKKYSTSHALRAHVRRNHGDEVSFTRKPNGHL